MSNVLNLPYVCNCGCNYVNGDMFTDYFMSQGTQPTVKDRMMYEAAKRVYWSMKAAKRDEALAVADAKKFVEPRKKRKYTKRSDRWKKGD